MKLFKQRPGLDIRKRLAPAIYHSVLLTQNASRPLISGVVVLEFDMCKYVCEFAHK